MASASPPALQSDIRPPPLIVESPEIKKNTLILLHGTSSNGTAFAKEVVNLVHFDLLLPYTKLIFPSGSLKKTTVFGGKLTHAWFDITDFADRTKGEQQQKEGLKESVEYLGQLVRDVVEDKSRDGRFDVFVGGMSQGCAMSLILLLSGELDRLGLSRKLGGFVGFSGWLPFRRQLVEVAAVGKDSMEKRYLVQEWLRSELGLPPAAPLDSTESLGKDMRIFLAHGTGDGKVKPEWGEDMKKILEAVGYKVEWKLYEDLGHVVVADELNDMVGFIKQNSRVQNDAIEEILVAEPTASPSSI
ncbi:hypothetical protein SS1G_02610 [Sclerotinia sclerotiorum 1980 UF-70]|uniref:Phospholipase/carboxylesterase/thioesterase domain-containing protein n=2 Tax=Sclerotinia sclerotiorum (strain ATCC 18683 / 1980 / Ss-1) TaxID=665079 RepID=A7EBC4_SCLS1|nr:hypothetical protein SS1G_02610 [Sclerotinia sclerotiorum 1980 UF-70]APA08816.1 hypothetical protein sscle_04g035860 [Sclerotinia sclerotiorum 1980 UF-70]EDN99752.1 hypothetical protein SS1G_02610 [Sclerotinia sclerotiorum 1980 UF-70]